MNRRTLKKIIRYSCTEIADECFFASELIPGIDVEKLTEAIGETASLQAGTLKRVSINFDKTPRDFANRKEYNRARNKYFRKAYGALSTEFNNQLCEIVKTMNSALPSKPEK